MSQATQSSDGLVSPRPTSGSNYLATLDGWRAIAIVGVIFSHGNLLSLGPINDRWLYEYGHFGVEVFFSISGLLICWRLLQEEKLQGRISLRSFYIRRGFRILPAAFAFLLVLVVLMAAHLIRLNLMEWISSAFFFRNYTSLLGNLTTSSYFTSHFWSLSLEEHFYLFLPALLVFANKRLRIPLLLLLTLAITGHRYFALRHSPSFLVDHHTGIRLDALLFPAMLAILVQPLRNRDLFRRFLKLWPLLAVLSFFIAPWHNGTFWKFSLVSYSSR